MRGAIERNVDVPAPGVLDAHPLELRKHPQHPGAGGARRVEGAEPGVVHTPAEEQPVIGRAAEVIEHPVHVADRRVVGDQPPRPLGTQGLGGDDVGRDRHDLGGERRGRGPEVHVAAERQVARAHLAGGGPYPHPGAVRGEARSARPLEDAHAESLGRGREPERVVEGMQVTAVAIVEPAEVALGRDRGAQLLAGHVAHARVSIALAQLVKLRLELAHVTLLDGDRQVPGRPVTLDRVARGQLADQREPLDRHLPHGARPARADQALELGLAGGDPVDRLRAAAPRGAPADPLLLEEHDGEALLGEVQRGRAPRDPGPDDAHVAVEAAGERRALRRGMRREGVVGADVRRASHGASSSQPVRVFKIF